MASPTPYALAYDFTSFQSGSPTTPLPADRIEIEFNALQTTTDEIIANLNLIQKSDGNLANNSVGNEQLKSGITIGVNPAAAWTTSTGYELNDTVYQNNNVYRCLESHTSGTFSVDLAASKWTLILDFNQFLSATEGDIASTEADLTAVEADLVLVEGDLTSVESDLSATESDLTATEADLSSVEADLAVMSPTVQTVTSTSNATTINLNNGRVFKHTFTENTTFSFTNSPASGTRAVFELLLINDGTGRTPTWPAAVDWPNGVTPDLTTANEVNLLTFWTEDAGTTWYGMLAGENFE